MNERNDSLVLSSKYPMYYIRDNILLLSVLAGSLAGLFLEVVHLNNPTVTPSFGTMTVEQQCNNSSTPKTTSIIIQHHFQLTESASKMMSALVKISMLLCIDLKLAVLRKIELNHQKYPKELCKVCMIW